MKCKAVIREIEELESGAPLSAEANAHLHTCAPCNAFHEERASLRRLVGRLEKVSAPADFDWKLRARLIEARSERGKERSLHTLFTPGAVALAASFVFMVVAVITYQQIKVLPSRASLSDTIASDDKKAKAAAPQDAASSDTKQKTVASADNSDGTVKKISNETARTRPAKSAKSNSARAEIASAAMPQRIFSNDSGSRGAEEFTIRGLQNSFTDAGGPVFPVSVRSLKPASLQFEDGEGTRRTLAPVSFGGQELIERKDAARLVTTSEKGIW